MQSYELELSRLLVVVSQTPSHHGLIFGAHLATVAVVDLLITDHIKDQIVVKAHQEPTKHVFISNKTLSNAYHFCLDYLLGPSFFPLSRISFQRVDS
jgi:hypothetical protein